MSARTIGINRKQDRAVELRAAGCSMQQIADELGYRDRAAASKAIRSALARVESDSVGELRQIQDQQLQRGIAAVFEILDRSDPVIDVPEGMDDSEGERWVTRVVDELNGDRDMRMKAVDRLVRLADRQAKLHGLDAPVKTELSGGDGITVMFSPALNPTATRPGGNK